ncbi:hypothetical protein, partial [Parafrankia sp. EUN1f]|uniref:hypothetical protein n=1 Tax=Parafrankia sp. EUN1f TaxID=102897 RepID=UPI0001C452FC
MSLATVAGFLLLLGLLAGLANDPDTPRGARRAAGRSRLPASRAAARAGASRARTGARAWRTATREDRRRQARTATVGVLRGVLWPAERATPAPPAAAR